ncbi:MAG: tRNA pseudouridine(55) synthase TruB [Oscillospiraceae bacterium]|nr:tRNA pseudouridine(55) synthase TruB [Oscillospiraceae bacterium]
MTGILIVDKPAGWTSQDVAAKLRSVFHERRVGHGGTLDPMATGVLPVFLGRATRAVPFFESAEKEYVAEIRFGLTTDTQDLTGSILRERPVSLTREQVETALLAMLGPQQQVPPMYSAVKIGGKKLYELARQGKEVARAPPQIELRELELCSFDEERASFRVLCSKGTYVRTICHDLGESLGCGGAMGSLRRTRAGRYTLDGAFSMEAILRGEADILPVDSLFSGYPAITLNPAEERLCRCGNAVPKVNFPVGRYRVYTESGEFLMLGQAADDLLSTVKSFFEVTP